MLDRGDVVNRAALARRFRVTRARVTQVLALLKLHPEIRAAIAALPPGTPDKVITERQLRRLTSLLSGRQLEALGWLLWPRQAG